MFKFKFSFFIYFGLGKMIFWKYDAILKRSMGELIINKLLTIVEPLSVNTKMHLWKHKSVMVLDWIEECFGAHWTNNFNDTARCGVAELQCNVVSTPLSCLLIHQHLSSLCSASMLLGQLKGNKPTPLVSASARSWADCEGWSERPRAHSARTQHTPALFTFHLILTYMAMLCGRPPCALALSTLFAGRMTRDLLSGANQPWTTFWHAFAKNSFPFPPTITRGNFWQLPDTFFLSFCAAWLHGVVVVRHSE